MAKVSIVLDDRRANSSGEFPIKIVIYQKTKASYISTGISVKKEYFIGDDDKVVRSTCPNSKLINASIESMYAKFFMEIKELEFKGIINSMSAVQIKDFILNKKEHTAPKENKEIGFIEYASKYAERANTISTYQSYMMMIRMVKEFFGDDVSFYDINFKSLSEFSSYYKKLSDATMGMMFRNIRAIFNQAIKEDLVDANKYPFHKFKIKSYKAQKDFMPIEFFKKFMQIDVSCSKQKQVAKDLFLLSFFFCGINPIDLFNIKGSDGFIKYERTKTKRHNMGNIIIKIQPEAQEIIDRYKGDEYLLYLAEKYKSFDTFYHNHRKYIKSIGNEIGFSELTFYYARYTWATYALNYCDVPEYIISKALGHADTTTATKYYIAFDWSKVDAANRKVIDYVMGKIAE